MKITFRSRQTLMNARGSMMIIMYFLIIVFTGISLALLIQGLTKTKVAAKYQANMIAYQNAHSGIDKMLADLQTDMTNSSSWSDGNINGMVIGPNTASYYSGYASTSLNSGTYTVTLKNVTGTSQQIWVKSVGTYGDVTKTIETLVSNQPLSMWNNAIFAGLGEPGSVIRGNTNISGSVIVVGTNLDSSDYALDLGGTAILVNNNYSGMTAAQRSLVPALPTTDVNGETVETLSATLRVQRGRIGLSGSAEVGQLDNPGDGYKETVDGVYVTDGFGGTQGTAGVHSDNGTSNAWDLGALSFPSLSTAYGGSASYGAYIQANGYTLTAAQVTALANVKPTSSFSYGNASGSISMDGSGNMTISGKLYMSGGNLAFNKNGSAKTITYSGTGILYVSGTVGINTNLIPANNGASPAAFPGNVLAILTPSDMTFNEAGITDYGMFYSEGTMTIQKQTNIIGTAAANILDMGINVPAIFQVPDLPDYLPTGMLDIPATTNMTIVVWLET